MDDYAVPDQSDLSVSLYDALIDVASADDTDARYLEGISDDSLAQDFFLVFRIEHALHGCLDIVDDVVNDSVEPDLDIGGLSLVSYSRCRSYVKADDDRVGCLGEHDVGFIDGTYAAVDDVDLDFRSLELLQR